MTNIQAAVTAAITQIVALVVAFGVVTNTEAGVIIAASTAVVNAAVVIGAAIEGYAKTNKQIAQIQAAKAALK
jgi:hypothetical protein